MKTKNKISSLTGRTSPTGRKINQKLVIGNSIISIISIILIAIFILLLLLVPPIRRKVVGAIGKAVKATSGAIENAIDKVEVTASILMKVMLLALITIVAITLFPVSWVFIPIALASGTAALSWVYGITTNKTLTEPKDKEGSFSPDGMYWPESGISLKNE